MGNQIAQEDKIVSTCWLGIKDDWECQCRGHLSRIGTDWAENISSVLHFDADYQIRFCENLNAILSNVNSLSSSQDSPLQSQTQQAILQSTFTLDNLKINQSQSLDLGSRHSQSTQEIKKEGIEQISSLIYDQKGPFYIITVQFQQFLKNRLTNIDQSRPATVGTSIKNLSKQFELFKEFMKEAFQKYIIQQNENINKLTKIVDHIIIDTTINQDIGNLFLQMQKVVDKPLHSIFKQKMIALMQHSTKLIELLEIPQKFVKEQRPFQKAIETLMEIQFEGDILNKLHILRKVERTILHQNRMSQAQLTQILNYVVLNARIVTLHSEINLMTLFFEDPVVNRFIQSLDYINKIVLE